MSRVLMVVSAADTLVLADGMPHPTGYWAEEVANSHRVLTDAGVDVVIATPGGAAPTVDAMSLDPANGVDPAAADAFRAYLAGIPDLAQPRALADIEVAAFDAVYLPGGHAPMTDLVDDADLARVLDGAAAANKVIAALCHGVVGLLSAATTDGWAFAGKRMTAFSNAEEQQAYGDSIPFEVETELRTRGAVVEVGAPWTDTVVTDGRLITGQNPQSTVSTASAVVAALSA